MQLEPIHFKLACVGMAIDQHMAVTQIQVGKNFMDDVLIDGGFRVNIITLNLKIQLGMSKPNLAPYNLRMESQTIVKALCLIRDLKIFVHGIPYIITFTIINSNVLDFSYSMLLGHLLLKDAKISHDWGTNNVII
jgi:hypothetical protein